MHEYSYTVLFEPAEEGGYVVTCPALPGVVTQGETLEEARAMAADAIRGYLESITKDGRPIPDDTAPEPIKEKITVVLQARHDAAPAGPQAPGGDPGPGAGWFFSPSRDRQPPPLPTPGPACAPGHGPRPQPFHLPDLLEKIQQLIGPSGA